jgi:hypothetical protein
MSWVVILTKTNYKNMKTRQGFVSNSSSSSFVLIIGKETADKIISTLNPSTKEIVNWLKKEIQNQLPLPEGRSL